MKKVIFAALLMIGGVGCVQAQTPAKKTIIKKIQP